MSVVLPSLPLRGVQPTEPCVDRGAGFRAAFDAGPTASDDLLDCVLNDPRWDRFLLRTSTRAQRMLLVRCCTPPCLALCPHGRDVQCTSNSSPPPILPCSSDHSGRRGSVASCSHHSYSFGFNGWKTICPRLFRSSARDPLVGSTRKTVACSAERNTVCFNLNTIASFS